MQLLFTSVLFAVVSLTASRGDSSYEDLSDDEKIYIFKNPKAYDLIVKQIEAEENAAKDGKTSDFSWFSAVCASTEGDQLLHRKCVKTVAKPLKRVFKLLKLTVPRGANPANDVITKAAKDLSQTFKDISIETLHEILYTDTPKGFKKDISILKEVFSTNPIQSGQQLLAKLSEKSKKLYCMTLDYQEQEKSADCKDLLKSYRSSVFNTFGHFQEVHEYMRDDDNVLDLVKNFASIVQTLKQPSSYDGLGTFVKAIAKNNFWTAISNTLKQAAGCARQTLVKPGQLNDLEKTLMIALEYMNMTFAEHDQEEEEPVPIQTVFFGFIFLEYIDVFTEITNQTLPKFWKCMRPNEERLYYENMVLSGDAVLSQEQLDEIKERNINAHAVLYLMNAAVTTMRRKHNLSAEAQEFYQKVVTLPNALLSSGDMAGSGSLAGTSEAILGKQTEAKAAAIAHLNQLTTEKRNELVERFPVEALALVSFLNYH